MRHPLIEKFENGREANQHGRNRSVEELEKLMHSETTKVEDFCAAKKKKPSKAKS